MRPAVFLDRDGTIAEEHGYLNHASRFRLLPCSASAIRTLADAGFAVFVVTNQSGVGRGYFPESLVHEIHETMQRHLAAEGVRLGGIYYCPHTGEEGCECRKPQPGMLLRAAREHGLNLAKSYVVGDRYADIETAHRAGARGVLVRTGYGAGELQWHGANWRKAPEAVADDVLAAAEWIVAQEK